jgi:hypothetical protein
MCCYFRLLPVLFILPLLGKIVVNASLLSAIAELDLNVMGEITLVFCLLHLKANSFIAFSSSQQLSSKIFRIATS